MEWQVIIDAKVLNIQSEIDPLKKVLLHRPGKELERIVPGILKEVLFEDIPWLCRMQEEHDAFARVLTDRGVEIYYIEDLLVQVLESEEVRRQLVEDVIDKNPSSGDYIDGFLREYLLSLTPSKLCDALIAGVLQKDLAGIERDPVLSDFIHEPGPYDFIINPLPNLYFMRDPAVTIGDGLCLSSMATTVRRRESLYMSYIYANHPLFASCGNKRFYKHDDFFSLEGGDVLVLCKDTVAVGCSERTTVHGIERLTTNLFAKMPEMRQVLVVKIPRDRAFMHLDTVFTMVDRDTFTIYPGIMDGIETVMITRELKAPWPSTAVTI